MKDINYSFLNSFYFTIIFGFSTIFSLQSQSIAKPTFLFFQACASSSFNSYPVNFVFAPTAAFGNGNTFFLQLSDASGNFPSSPTEVASSSTITVSPGSLTFNVPVNFMGGENYRFRIRSTSPALLSIPSNAVPIYYQTFTENFFINNKQSTAQYCTGGTLNLSIDTPTMPPASLSNLSYRWFRNNVQIAGSTGITISVNQPGTYYVEINYGSCSTQSSITRSQDVVVTAAPAVAAVAITSDSGTVIPAGAFTTLSTVQNSSFAYQWFRDGVLIPSAINFNYVTNQPGVYYVSVTNGACNVQSNSIALTAQSTIPIGVVIPNLVSPNNDGANDTWVIPAAYISGTNTEVTITDAVGQVILQTTNYSNDFPTTTIDFKSVNPVYYYVIKTESGEVIKGSVTLIK